MFDRSLLIVEAIAGIGVVAAIIGKAYGFAPSLFFILCSFAATFTGWAVIRAAAAWRDESLDITGKIHDTEREALEQEKLILLQGIKELEADLAVGKVDKRDYEYLRKTAEAKAIAIIERLRADEHRWTTEAQALVRQRLGAKAAGLPEASASASAAPAGSASAGSPAAAGSMTAAGSSAAGSITAAGSSTAMGSPAAAGSPAAGSMEAAGLSTAMGSPTAAGSSAAGSMTAAGSSTAMGSPAAAGSPTAMGSPTAAGLSASAASSSVPASASARAFGSGGVSAPARAPFVVPTSEPADTWMFDERPAVMRVIEGALTCEVCSTKNAGDARYCQGCGRPRAEVSA